MRRSDCSRYALGFCAALLAGCGGSQPPIGAEARGRASSQHFAAGYGDGTERHSWNEPRPRFVARREGTHGKMKILALSRYGLGVCATAALLAACSSGGSQLTPSSSHLFGVGSAGAQMPSTRMPLSKRSRKLVASYLYAAAYDGESVCPPSTGGCIVEYANGAGMPVRTISDGIERPLAIALDSAGNLYSANPNTVTVYAPDQTTVLRTLTGVNRPRYVASDGSNIYVANAGQDSAIAVFKSGSSTPSRYIKKGVTQPWVDQLHSGYLYVGNATNSVTEYAPGGSTPIRTITSGLNFPRAFAFDGAGNLYVANSALTGHEKKKGSVTVYAPGTTTMLRRITAGIGNPLALAFGATGNLFVANTGTSTVTVYAAGSNSVLRTLKTLLQPRALAIGRSGDVYVGEEDAAIEVFAPGGTTPIRTIQQGGWALIRGKS